MNNRREWPYTTKGVRSSCVLSLKWHYRGIVGFLDLGVDEGCSSVEGWELSPFVDVTLLQLTGGDIWMMFSTPKVKLSNMKIHVCFGSRYVINSIRNWPPDFWMFEHSSPRQISPNEYISVIYKPHSNNKQGFLLRKYCMAKFNEQQLDGGFVEDVRRCTLNWTSIS